MAFILKKGVWRPQQVPVGPIEVDWDHPLSQGLVAFWPLNGTLQDLVVGNNLSTSAYSTFGAAPNGVSLLRSVTTSGGNIGRVPPITGTGPYSIFFQFATTDTATGSSDSAISWGTANTGEQVQLDVENGVLWARNQSNTAYAGSGFNDNNVHSYGYSKPLNGTVANIVLYGDGKSLAATTSGTTILNLGAAFPAYVGSTFASANNGFLGSLSGMRVWNRVLTPAEFFWLNSEPWAHVDLASPARHYSIPVSGGTVYNDTLAESGSASDAAAATAIFASAFSESGSAADIEAATAIYLGSLSEAGSASDAETNTASFLNSLAEAGAASDNEAASAAFVNTLTEAGAAADALATTMQMLAALVESGAASDFVTYGSLYNETLAEAASAADALASTAQTANAIAEVGAASDALNAGILIVSALSEAGASSDSIGAATILTQSIVEAGAASDIVVAVAQFVAECMEAGSAADAIIGGLLFVASLAESGAAADALVATSYHGLPPEAASTLLGVLQNKSTLKVLQGDSTAQILQNKSTLKVLQ